MVGGMGGLGKGALFPHSGPAARTTHSVTDIGGMSSDSSTTGWFKTLLLSAKYCSVSHKNTVFSNIYLRNSSDKATCGK